MRKGYSLLFEERRDVTITNCRVKVKVSEGSDELSQVI